MEAQLVTDDFVESRVACGVEASAEDKSTVQYPNCGYGYRALGEWVSEQL